MTRIRAARWEPRVALGILTAQSRHGHGTVMAPSRSLWGLVLRPAHGTEQTPGLGGLFLSVPLGGLILSDFSELLSDCVRAGSGGAAGLRLGREGGRRRPFPARGGWRRGCRGEDGGWREGGMWEWARRGLGRGPCTGARRQCSV